MMKSIKADEQGVVNLFVHGLLSGRHTFSYSFSKLKNSRNFIDGGVITFRKELDGSINRDVEIKTNTCDIKELLRQYKIARTGMNFEKLDKPEIILTSEFENLTYNLGKVNLKEKINYLTKKGYNVGFRFEGSKINSYTMEVVSEVEKALQVILPKGKKVNLIGHSQGGITSVKTSLRNSDKINKVITISTPYAPNVHAYVLGESKFGVNCIKFSGGGTKDLSGKTTFLKDLVKEWNEWGYQKIDLTMIGLGKKCIGDFVVDGSSQLGYYKDIENQYKNVKRYFIPSNGIKISHNINYPRIETQSERLASILKELLPKKREVSNADEQTNHVSYRKVLDRIAKPRYSFYEDVVSKMMRFTGRSKKTNIEFLI